MEEFINSLENEDIKKWAQIITESIRRKFPENAEAALNDPKIVLQTAAITCDMMFREIKLQSSGILAQVDQIVATVRDKK